MSWISWQVINELTVNQQLVDSQFINYCNNSYYCLTDCPTISDKIIWDTLPWRGSLTFCLFKKTKLNEAFPPPSLPSNVVPAPCELLVESNKHLSFEWRGSSVDCFVLWSCRIWGQMHAYLELDHPYINPHSNDTWLTVNQHSWYSTNTSVEYSRPISRDLYVGQLPL